MGGFMKGNNVIQGNRGLRNVDQIIEKSTKRLKKTEKAGGYKFMPPPIPEIPINTNIKNP